MTPKLFSELGLSADVLKAIDKLGFEQASPIQAEAIPVLMTGKDIVGQSQTGSGKTLAFGVPMMSRIDSPATPGKPHGLVIVPTRELALQVSEVLGPIGKHCGVRVLAVYGGADRQKQVVEIAWKKSHAENQVRDAIRNGMSATWVRTTSTNGRGPAHA